MSTRLIGVVISQYKTSNHFVVYLKKILMIDDRFFCFDNEITKASGIFQLIRLKILANILKGFLSRRYRSRPFIYINSFVPHYCLC